MIAILATHAIALGCSCGGKVRHAAYNLTLWLGVPIVGATTIITGIRKHRASNTRSGPTKAPPDSDHG